MTLEGSTCSLCREGVFAEVDKHSCPECNKPIRKISCPVCGLTMIEKTCEHMGAWVNEG